MVINSKRATPGKVTCQEDVLQCRDSSQVPQERASQASTIFNPSETPPFRNLKLQIRKAYPCLATGTGLDVQQAVSHNRAASAVLPDESKRFSMSWVPLSLAIASVLLVGARAQVPVLLNGTSATAIQTSNGQFITISVTGVFLATAAPTKPHVPRCRGGGAALWL